MAACTGGGPAPELVEARSALAAAMVLRVPEEVGPAARAADGYRGRDADLDRLLGDALANVLMQPGAGLALLDGVPLPQDPAWVRARQGALLRAGDLGALEAAWTHTAPLPESSAPLWEQVGAHARRDPGFGPEDAAEVFADCALLDRQPMRGRKALDMPANQHLIAAAVALGATRVVVARPPSASDPDPLEGQGAWMCNTGRLEGWTELPARLPRGAVVAASDGQTDAWLMVKTRQEGGLWAYGAYDMERGARWVGAALLIETLDDPEQADAAVRTRYGHGLAAGSP